MTFEQFQATRRECDDIGAVIPDARWDDEPVAKGFTYLGDKLYIEKVQPHWPDAAKAQGKYHLLIERDEWISNDLEMLECELYGWAKSAGYFKSWAAEVIADSSGKWVGNALRFATATEAERYVSDLAMRWTAVRQTRVVESDDPITEKSNG
jgi:hypothetical protein